MNTQARIEPPSAPQQLPLDFGEQYDKVMASRALRAFARRRVGQMIYRGHTTERDLEKGIGQIAAEAQYRLAALHDIVGRYRMNLPPERRKDCMKYIESAGAVLISLWERCQVEVPEE
jgi:hypothetical protein